MTQKEIYNSMYNHYIYFVHKDKKGEWRKNQIYKQMAVIAGEMEERAGTIMDDNGIILIVADIKDFSSVAHEALHAVCKMLERKGIIDIMSNDNEPFAYALSWLIDEIYKTAEA